MGDKLVLDIETKKSFDEVGGHHNSHLLEASVCVVYSYDRDEFRAFKEEDFKEMGEWLKNASLIIGFNSKHFDFAVLQPYYKFNLSKLPHLDILEEIYLALGHRLKLESVAQSTLGEGKSGSGLDAIWYYKNQDWEKLIKYCTDDVRVTRDVYEYGRRHGNLWYENSGKKTPIKVRWAEPEVLSQKIVNAYKNGDKVEIEHLKTEACERGKKTIDIKAIKNNQVQAFCHDDQSIKIFNIDRIFDLKILGRSQSWQTKLF